ncbi:MAG: hypothetical protein HFI72_01780 [Peptococcaceae bacterium]|jgi:hypothetical protein|nr:hypothetical protein [Peptococcaceae bacterium]
MTQDNNKKRPYLFRNAPRGVFTYPIFAANREAHHIYGALEEKRLAKEKKAKLQQKTRHKYQQAAKGFFGSSLQTDMDMAQQTLPAPTDNGTKNIPPFTALPRGQRFSTRFQQPVNNTIIVVPPGTGDTASPDIILSVSLLLSSPPVPLVTLTMPLNAEISASITLPLNYYEEDADISAIFAVAYTINANLIIAMAFPNDTYTHFTNPTVTLIFGLPINYMSGLSIPVAFGTEGPTYPVLIVNPLATPENPESGDVVVPPEAPIVP